MTQYTTIRAIRRAGGHVETSSYELSSLRQALARLLPDAFAEIDVIYLADVSLDRRWLPTIRRSDRLAFLWLNRSGATDDDLRSLCGKQRLWELYLNGNPITDRGLRNLGQLPSLERLQLNYTGVRDPGIVAHSMPRIVMLKLRGTEVTDAAIWRIQRMPSLREIDLSRTKITDLALQRLSTLRELDSVQLEDTCTSKSGAHTLHADLTPNCTVFAADGTCLVAAKYRN